MKLLTLPRSVAATEYFFLRLPVTALHRGVLEPRLGSDSRALHRFERAVGKLDMAAGTLFADPDLHRRGTVLARKAQANTLAQDLSVKAQYRAEAADAELEQKRREAAEHRETARAEAQAQAEAVEADRRASKLSAERAAATKAAAAETAARRQAQAARANGHAAATATLTNVEKRAAAKAAVPTQQLKHSAQAATSAATKRAEADRLAELAAAKKAKRTGR